MPSKFGRRNWTKTRPWTSGPPSLWHKSCTWRSYAYAPPISNLRTSSINKQMERLWVHSFPIIANLFMEHIEEKAITSAPFQPRLWTRYVDDTFIISPHGPAQLQRLHEHLNQLCPDIHHGETEDDGKIPFLDVRTYHLMWEPVVHLCV